MKGYYKCDQCGKIFWEEDTRESIEKPKTLKIGPSKVHAEIKKKIFMHQSYQDSFADYLDADLCPDCTIKFINVFMHTGKAAE